MNENEYPQQADFLRYIASAFGFHLTELRRETSDIGTLRQYKERAEAIMDRLKAFKLLSEAAMAELIALDSKTCKEKLEK